MQVTRGMRRRSEKLARHRERLPADALIAGVDLGKKRSVVMFVRAADRARVGRLDISSDPTGRARLIARGRELAVAHGTGPLVVAMEPTSHFWKPLARAVDAAGVPYVLVQGFVVARARELDDLTPDKTDTRDAGLIADLAAELRFTDTRLPEGPWAESALLVEARDARRIERSAALQETRALLELAWPGLLLACPALTGSHLGAILRSGHTPQQLAALSARRFGALLRRHHEGRFMASMARRLHTAARDVAALPETPAAALRWRLAVERVALADAAITELDQRLVELFELTGYGWLRGQIRGLGDPTLAALFALTGDPARYDDARCLVKLAGTNPTARSSSGVRGGRGHPPPGPPAVALPVLPGCRHPGPPRARLQASLWRAHRLRSKPPPGAQAGLRGPRQQAAAHAVVDGGERRGPRARHRAGGQVRPLPRAA